MATKHERLIAISSRELIAETGSILAAEAECARIIATADLPTAGKRFYRTVAARLHTMAINDRIGFSEIAAWFMD